LKILEFKKLTSEEADMEITKNDNSVYHWNTHIREDFYNDLANPGTTFSHSRVDNITLKDLFVVPNLRRITIGKVKEREKPKIERADTIFSKTTGEGMKIVVYGDDSCGKTTLSRWAYEKLYDEGFIPILINGSDLKDIAANKIYRVFQQAFQKQYNGLSKVELKNFQRNKIIAIVDDFHRIRVKESRFKATLIRGLEQQFEHIILTGNDLMQYES
jgi:hypothetical protein